MYYIVFGFLYLFSLLPMRVLYLISDFAAFILRVFSYRHDVVMSNLEHAFPEKSSEERKKIAAKFYHNFTDNWIETIKLLSISKREMNKKITGNYEVFYELHKTGKAVQVNLAHFFNWEIMTLHAGINQPYTFLTVYLPQSSKIFDRLLKYIRGRWGNPLISSKDMAREIIPWRKKQYLLALGADQSPGIPDSAYWLYFMHRPAGFAKGPEKYARGQNIPVVMMTTTKVKRGHYHFDYFLLCEEPKSLPDGELMRQYVHHVEANMRLQPELYLWSHRRWKWNWEALFEKLWVDNVPMPKL
ncbi:MAG: lysophospholipid acyltransferase family protein [Ferruginibacter sp.]